MTDIPTELDCDQPTVAGSPNAGPSRGRPALSHDNERIRDFLSDCRSEQVDSRVESLITGALELQAESRSSTRTLRRKVLRAILEHCDRISVAEIRQRVTRDRYADRTLRQYAEVARVVSKGIASALLARAFYDRAAQEWHLLGEHVTARVEFIPAATGDGDPPERPVMSVRQARKDIDAPFAQALEAAVALAVPWSAETARGLVEPGQRVVLDPLTYIRRMGQNLVIAGTRPMAVWQETSTDQVRSDFRNPPSEQSGEFEPASGAVARRPSAANSFGDLIERAA